MSTPVIEAEGLTKRYGETQALAGVSLAVALGWSFAITGICAPLATVLYGRRARD